MVDSIPENDLGETSLLLFDSCKQTQINQRSMTACLHALSVAKSSRLINHSLQWLWHPWLILWLLALRKLNKLDRQTDRWTNRAAELRYANALDKRRAVKTILYWSEVTSPVAKHRTIVTQWSLVRAPVAALSSNNCGQVVHTHERLSSSSIAMCTGESCGVISRHPMRCISSVSVASQRQLVSGIELNWARFNVPPNTL